MPSNSTRPLSSVFRARRRESPPAFLMMALTSTFATAFAGILRATRTLTVPAGIPRSGSGSPDDLRQVRHLSAATAAAHHGLRAGGRRRQQRRREEQPL